MAMTTPGPRGRMQEDEADPEIVPWTAEQARAWRERNPSLSPWKVVGMQVVVGASVVLLAWLWSGKPSVTWSAAYGALAVVLPAALFARGLTGRLSRLNPATAAMGFLVWEMVKLALTLAMLIAAPRLVAALSWPALLVGLVLTLKVYWGAMLVVPRNVKQKDE